MITQEELDRLIAVEKEAWAAYQAIKGPVYDAWWSANDAVKAARREMEIQREVERRLAEAKPCNA